MPMLCMFKGGCEWRMQPLLPHAIAIATAEVTDRKGTLQALDRCKSGLCQVKAVLTNNSYAASL